MVKTKDNNLLLLSNIVTTKLTYNEIIQVFPVVLLKDRYHKFVARQQIHKDDVQYMGADYSVFTFALDTIDCWNLVYYKR